MFSERIHYGDGQKANYPGPHAFVVPRKRVFVHASLTTPVTAHRSLCPYRFSLDTTISRVSIVHVRRKNENNFNGRRLFCPPDKPSHIHEVRCELRRGRERDTRVGTTAAYQQRTVGCVGLRTICRLKTYRTFEIINGTTRCRRLA